MPGFVPEYPSAFRLARPLDLQHLAALQPHQAGMREIEGNGEPEHAIGVEEFLRQPGMRQRDDVVRLQLAMQSLHPALHQRAFKSERKVAQARFQQRLVRGILEHKQAARALPPCPHRTAGHDTDRRRTTSSSAPLLVATRISSHPP